MSKIVLTGKGTDIAVLENLTPADLFAPAGTEPVFEAIKNEVAAFVPDMTTESGRKDIASMAYKIAQSKNFLDKVGKIFNSDLKEKTKAVDAERKAIWDKLEALQKEVRTPLDAYEAAEEARVQAHKDAMAEVTALTTFTESPTVEQIRQRIERGLELSNRQWDEFADMATEQLFPASHRLGTMLIAAEQAVKDQAELEALRAAKAAQDAKDAEAARQKAADEQRAQIERDAQAKAQRDAEVAIQAEKDKAAKAAADAAATLKAAEDKAAKDKADADARAKAADDARIAAEAKAKLEADAAVQREKDRAAAEKSEQERQAKLREADREHRAKINNAALDGIAAILEIHQDHQPKAIVEAIIRGEIPHITITY